jgi:hypothetical protein
VNRAIWGKRGQKLLRDLLAALDALPRKRLIAEEFENEAGEVCALGALGRERGVNLATLEDPYDRDVLARVFDVAPALANEIQYINDEWIVAKSPEDRWSKMRAWVVEQIREAPAR